VTVALALAAALAYGAADFCGGIATRRTQAAAVVILSQLGAAVVLAAAWVTFPGGGRFYSDDVVYGLCVGLAGAIAITALYGALAIGRMGVVSPITAVVGASVPVVTGFGLGQRPTLAAGVGVGLALVAVVLVSIDAETRSFSLRAPGIGLALVSGLAIGASYVFLSLGHNDGGFDRLAIARVVTVALLIGYALARRQSLRAAPGGLPLIVGAGALDMSANVLYILAARSGLLAIAAVLTSLYPASTVLLARIFLRERLAPLQWVGVAVAACGVVLIALPG
jgi:drug/metabolite transporter (DMT)-like permease